MNTFCYSTICQPQIIRTVTKASLLFLALFFLPSINSSAQCPTIANPGFESGDSGWLNAGLGDDPDGTGNFNSGSSAAQLNAGDIIYQQVTVTPNTDYVLVFYYTIDDDNFPPDNFTLDVLAGGGYTTPAGVAAATVLGTYTGLLVSGKKNYYPATIKFNSGANTTISIYAAHNGSGDTVRLDDFDLLCPPAPLDCTCNAGDLPVVRCSSFEDGCRGYFTSGGTNPGDGREYWENDTYNINSGVSQFGSTGTANFGSQGAKFEDNGEYAYQEVLVEPHACYTIQYYQRINATSGGVLKLDILPNGNYTNPSVPGVAPLATVTHTTENDAYELETLTFTVTTECVVTIFISNPGGTEDSFIDDITFIDKICKPEAGCIMATCTSLFLEDFDGSNTTNPPVLPACVGNSRDYFGIVCDNGAGCTDEINAGFMYNGSQGQYFGARDFDGPCGGFSQTISFTGIDISPCSAASSVYLCMDLAESQFQLGTEFEDISNPIPMLIEETWDANSNVNFVVTIDDCQPQEVTAIESSDGGETRPGIDIDCGGGNAGGPLLSDTWQTFCFELTILGGTLDLDININDLNTDGEDIAIDNIEIFCADDPSCLPATPTPSCANEAPICCDFSFTTCLFLEDFDGSNATNPVMIPATCSTGPSRDYFGIVCDNGAGCSDDINAGFNYIGSDGQYLGVRDMDNVCGGSQAETVSFTGIDITACSANTSTLYFCLDLAESQFQLGTEYEDMSGPPSMLEEETWDGNSNVNFQVSIDGCDFQEISAIESSDGGDSRPAIDLDCGGGDGAGQEMSDTWTTFCFEMNALGSTLDLDININGLNTDGEDIAIDNIKVYCVDRDPANPFAPPCLPAEPTPTCTTDEPECCSGVHGPLTIQAVPE